jgi:hypothetical protein
MTTVAGFDYFEVEFTKDGSIDDRNQVKELTDSLSSDGVTDLVVLAHGWNNDMGEARRLYERLLGSVKTQLSDAELGERKLGVLAVLWPSKRFAEEELIAGGGASVTGAPDETELVDRLEGLKGTFDDDNADDNLEKAKSLIPKLGEDKEAQKEFVDLIRASLREDDADDEDASAEFFALPGDEVIARLAIPDVETGAAPVAGMGGVASMTDAGSAPAPQGGAAGIGDWIENARNAARNLLNFATYYQMKSRAGTVGNHGVYEVLREARTARPDLKLHLVGHSFGGRLVTAAATGPSGEDPIGVDSLMLLQAAFSHLGFAQDYEGSKDGLFRSMITGKAVKGPALITHTDNDRAVGLAYPLASRIARQVASGLGDKNDKYGGIGRNGAQKTPEAKEGVLLKSGSAYQLEAGGMYNLRSDDFISNHSDVTGPEVAQALVAAIAVT